MIRALRASAIASLTGLVVGGVAAVLPAGAGLQSEPATTVEFPDVGTHEWVVPADVCRATFELFGAQGGGGGTFGDNPGGRPGRGGSAAATIAVTPGELIVVTVGGAGSTPAEPAPVEYADVGTAAGNGAGGGFNGGAPGGAGAGAEGGGGGGATDVRQGGTGLDARVLVAGGGGAGGGGGPAGFGAAGGDGGGATGSDGSDGEPPVNGGQQGFGGGGGTSAGPGLGGDGFEDGLDGSTGLGGDGADGLDGAGGGGGGWFGGGGGGSGSSATGAGGGGGSGFGPAGAVLTSGVQDGDGFATVAYAPDPAGCAAPIIAEIRFTG